MSAVAARQIVREDREQTRAPELTLLEGRTRERREQSARHKNNICTRTVAKINPSIALFVSAVILIALVVLMRLTTQTMTSALMMESASLNKRITASEHTVDKLQVQHAIFANPDRIKRIASGSLGMVDSNKVAQLDVSKYSGDKAASQTTSRAVAETSQVVAGPSDLQE